MHPTPEELATQLAAAHEPRHCERWMPTPIATDAHYCDLYDCPTDDPDHIHQCYSNDFDWTEGEYQKYRLGKITGPKAIHDLQMIGRQRAAERCRLALDAASGGSIRPLPADRSGGFISIPSATWRTET